MFLCPPTYISIAKRQDGTRFSLIEIVELNAYHCRLIKLAGEVVAGEAVAILTVIGSGKDQNV